MKQQFEFFGRQYEIHEHDGGYTIQSMPDTFVDHVDDVPDVQNAVRRFILQSLSNEGIETHDTVGRLSRETSHLMDVTVAGISTM